MPVFDVGFIDAVRNGVTEVVPGVTALDGRAVVLADGSRVSPDAVVAATGYHPGLAPLVGHLTAMESTVFQARDRVSISSEYASQSLDCCTRSAWMPDTLQEMWRENLAP